MPDYHTSPRLFIPENLAEKLTILLEPEQSHYLTGVLRLKIDDPVRLFNGKNGEWLAHLGEIKKHSVSLHVEEALKAQKNAPNLWLCCAPIKRAHFDFMVMKATELGAACIQPLLTNRTQVRETNTNRLRAIAIEAAEQSERLDIPEIDEPISLKQLLATWPQGRIPLICAEFGEAEPIESALRKIDPTSPVSLITGPEGGFMPEEMEALRQLPSATALRLGPRILRADTAALAALTCWQSICGDWQ